ncbi:hypothetical protein I5Q34_34155 [Streptomyces sp. AV19]|uniref:zinc finger domain-containing protein n=1 Tax=Streptomyces sp. AV19 TaxID=2793068 RepID=UPI0018FE427D|nr:hypothetical protein [Streptomyces sp. AV19]MBH1939244.1 hypothetical protein [Streptomyces sp. AV19]MDG4531656.1 hypothetical protein [Streptomyces sp. AV19]
MTPAQTAELLAFCAAFDRRTVGRADVLAWHTVLGNLDFDAARQAVAAHYSSETRWIMPADIITAVRAVRRDRLERHTEAEPPPGDTGDNAYQAALLAERRAIADGNAEPRPVPALPPGESQQPMNGRARTVLAAVGNEVPGRRDGVVNVLAVPCRICHARPGRTCTSPRNTRRRRADVHPARLEDARRAAAGQPPIDPAEAQQELERRLEASRTALAALPPDTVIPAPAPPDAEEPAAS